MDVMMVEATVYILVEIKDFAMVVMKDDWKAFWRAEKTVQP